MRRASLAAILLAAGCSSAPSVDLLNNTGGPVTLRFGVEPNRAALETIIDIAARQKLIPTKWRVEELFDDTTRVLRAG